MAESFRDDSSIAFLEKNPKRAGTKAHDRYEKYKIAKTVGEALKLGASKGDISNDLQKGHGSLANAAVANQGPAAVALQPQKRAADEAAAPAAKQAKLVVPELAQPLLVPEPVPQAKPEAAAQVAQPQPAPLLPEPQPQLAQSAVTSSATPQGRPMAYEADLTFAKLEGKPIKFVKRAMGEARKLLSERGLEENRQAGLEFTLRDRDNLSKYAVTVRDLNTDGQLYKDLMRLGIDASIDFEVCLPDGFPLDPPFVRVVYPQLTGGFVFQHGGICFEPLTEKGWAPSMTVSSLCMAVKAILDYGEVRVAGVGNKETRTVPGYTEEGARKDAKFISQAHRGGDARTYQQNIKS